VSETFWLAAVRCVQSGGLSGLLVIEELDELLAGGLSGSLFILIAQGLQMTPAEIHRH